MDEEIRDILRDAKKELKRVEHLVYVSLKYTRTVDVLKNVLSRMTEAYEELFIVLYNYKKEDEAPTAPVRLAREIDSLYEDEEITKNVETFILLRKIYRAPNPIREEEYRRHVAMKTYINGREEVFNIDLAMQYFGYLSEFYEIVEKDILPDG